MAYEHERFRSYGTLTPALSQRERESLRGGIVSLRMSAVESDLRSGLRALFAPRSVALIGASADPISISARPLRLLRQHGFAGDVYPVNPKYTELEGLRVYASIAEVPTQVDLALIAVPASSVARVLEECAAARVRCVTTGTAPLSYLFRCS